MKTRTIFATLAVPATAVGLFAQDNVVMTRGIKTADETVVLAQGAVGMVGLSAEPGNVRFMTQEFSFSGRVVPNAPYSADETTESVQTLADGTRITNTTTSKIYRDSQGRTRREMTLPGFGGDAKHTLVSINDPVAGMNYTFDPENKTAHSMPGLQAVANAKMRGDMEYKLKAEAEVRSKEAATNTSFIRRAPAPTSKREDLGASVVEGVNATGTAETSTIDAGAIGNDRAITIKSERWYSPDLQIEVKSVHEDPRMGRTTHTLSNISRVEPDATLFQVPSDYKLDEGKPGMQIRKFEVHPN